MKYFLTLIVWLTVMNFSAQSSIAYSKDQIKLGKSLYDKYSCKSCHGDKGVLQGDLTRAFEKYDDSSMEAYIKNPHQFKNFKMPVYLQVIPQQNYPPLIRYIRYLGQQASENKKRK